MPVDLPQTANQPRQRLLDKDTATVSELASALTEQDRKSAERYVYWWDHGLLRTFWTNFGEVAPDVYRSNQPNHARLESYRDMGIKAVLNLRGSPKKPHHILEVRSCQMLGLELRSVALHARMAPQIPHLQALFDAFDTIARPFVMHCKSGADRAGLAAVLYRLDQGEPLADARKELSFRYLHIKHSKTGIQDHFLDAYEARLKDGPISIRAWIEKEYDPKALTASFAKVKRLPI